MSWPRFAIFYRDDIVEGGGPEEETIEVTMRFPRSWIEAPADGVQAVIVECDYASRSVWRSSDFFYWVPGGEVCSTDDIGPYLRGFAPWIKHGLCLSALDFERVMARAKEYDRIPRTGGPRKPRPDAGLERMPDEEL